MKPPGTIRSNCPQVTRQGIFNLSFRGTYNLSNRSAFMWHDIEIGKNPGYNSIFENAQRENYFEVEKMDAKIRITSTRIASTRITPTQFPPTWQTSKWKINMICQTFNRYKIYFSRNNNSTQLLIYALVHFLQQHLWHTITGNWYTIYNICNKLQKNDPPPPSNGQSPPTGITPTENPTSYNNLPKQVPRIPNEPDSNPS